MRTPLVLSLMLATGLILTGCAGSKVAVVNSARIYQESAAGKAGLAYLEQVEKDAKTKAEAALKVAESMPNNDAMPSSLQKFYITCQEAMNSAQQQAVNSVQELITRSIASYREQKQVTVIMQNDAVVSADPTADVTDAIIAQMNKTQVSFPPVQIPDFVAPPAPVKATPPPAPTKRPARAPQKTMAPKAAVSAPQTTAPAAPTQATPVAPAPAQMAPAQMTPTQTPAQTAPMQMAPSTPVAPTPATAPVAK